MLASCRCASALHLGAQLAFEVAAVRPFSLGVGHERFHNTGPQLLGDTPSVLGTTNAVFLKHQETAVPSEGSREQRHPEAPKGKANSDYHEATFVG